MYYVTTVTAMCVLAKEKAQNFQFAFESYVEAGFNIPDIIWSDQDSGLLKSINDES